MKVWTTRALAAAVLALGTAGCHTTSATPAPSPTSTANTNQYVQIERLARPAVKEAFQNYNDHDTTNRSSPMNDPLLPGAISSFEMNVAGRSNTTATAMQSILIPDEIAADLSQSNPAAAYLGIETGGATSASGSKFGGRDLRDDVIAISLGAIFGNTLSALGVVPDDHKESPCLVTDNVSAPNSDSRSTFPYLAPPH